MTGLLHKNLTNFCTQESFGGSGLVAYPKMSLYKLISFINSIQSTSNLQPMYQSLFIKSCLLYKSLLDHSELEFLEYKII